MEAVQVRPPDQPEPGGGDPTTPTAPRSIAASVPPLDSSGVTELPTTDFVTCYELHYRRLVRALELAGADRQTAEDVAQDAFARALVHWWRVRRGPNPPGYVYTAGFRLLARARRRSARDRLDDDSPAGAFAAAAPGGPDPTAQSAVSSLDIRAALAGMPPRRRACAVMCLVVGLSVAEAGEALGIADGTVRKHLDEARKNLALHLDGG